MNHFSFSATRFSKLLLPLATGVALAAMPAVAQDTPVPTAPTAKYPVGPRVSRVDLYGGYGYLHPVDSNIGNYYYQPINPGAVASISGYFTRNFGLQAEGSFFPHGPNDCFFSAQAGPVARIQRGRFVPFAHALGGGTKVGGPVFQPCTWGYGFTGGVGTDYILPAFHDRIAIRPIEADYVYSHVDYGPIGTPNVSGGLGKIQAYRLSAGVVLRFGDMTPPPPVALSCAVQPSSVYGGDPLTLTATATNLDPRHPADYSYTSTGGAVTGSSSVANIPTAGARPGSYTVTGKVSQGSKPYQSAVCTASYVIKDYDPPTLTCSANPSTVNLGEPATITSTGNSPQNRALTYSYSTSAGRIVGTGATTSLVTLGVQPGTVAITCDVVDDLGKSASANTTVVINTPPVALVPAVPQPVALCGVSFDRDQKRPNRVDNEAKACLDDLSLSLQRQTDSRLVITGNHGNGETDQNSAARAANVRLYLINEKGIDASRIELRTGDAGKRSVENTLLPAGATFPTGATTIVDPATVTPRGQSYGTPKPAAKARRR